MFTALTVVGAFIRIPLPPAPFTMQLFIIILAGLILGSRLAFLSQLLYIAIGLVGMPVFASGGGVQYVFMPTFGYILGGAGAAFVVGLLTGNAPRPSLVRKYMAGFAGILVCYLIGVPYLYFILKYVGGSPLSILDVVMKGCLFFLPWDLAKIADAVWMASVAEKRADLTNLKTRM
jgi:biotin transport system substrate-specific component